MSGTNAHVIVEEAGPVVAAPPRRDAMVPWMLSARSETALRTQAERLRAFVAAEPGVHPADIGLTLATARSRFEHRATVVGTGTEELLDGLAHLDPVVAGGGPTAFLFTGQGAQRTGMGEELAGAFPVFAEAYALVCASFDPLLDRPLREVIASGEGLDETVYAQPALFALEVALARLLESWGVLPDLLVGHSIGELAAAHVAGVWSLGDAVTVVAARARLMQALPSGGVMVAVEASEAEVVPALVAGAEIAAVNGPASVVLSGDEEPVLAVAARWKEQGRRTRRLSVSHAFHSHRMEPMLAEFGEVLASVSYGEPRVPIVSSVVEGGDVTDPAYWLRNAREAVRFADAVERAGTGVFLELGPDAVLTALTDGALPLLRKGRPETVTLVDGLARSGADVDWAAFFAATGARPADLPTYPFQRSRFWPETHGRPPADRAASWRYRVRWEPVRVTPDAILTGRWIVAVPATRAGDPLVTAVLRGLADRGVNAVELGVPDLPDRARLAEAVAGPVDGVLSFLALGYQLKNSKVLWLVVALAFVSVLWSDVPGFALRRCLNMAATSGLGLYLSYRCTPRQVLRLLGWVLVIAIVCSIAVVVLRPELGIDSSQTNHAWKGIFVQKNTLGRLMSLGVLVFIFLAAESKSHRWAYIVASLMCAGMIFLSGSATSALAIPILLVMLWIFSMSRRRSMVQVSLWALIAAAGIGSAVLLFTDTSDLFSALGRNDTLSGRLDIWSAVIPKISAHPWLGYGYSSFWLGMESQYSADLWAILKWHVPHSHNGFLDLTEELGIVGLCSFLAGYILSLRRGLQWARRQNSLIGLWPLAYLTFMFLFNLTEGSILKQDNLFWVLYVATSVYVVAEANKLSAKAAQRAGNRVGVPAGALYPALGSRPDTLVQS